MMEGGVEHAIATLKAAKVKSGQMSTLAGNRPELVCSGAHLKARHDGPRHDDLVEDVQDATSSPPPPPFVVPPPFDESSPGDYYFLSSDGVRFKVLSHSLIHVTPYFQDLFHRPPPSSSPSLPTISFDEDARTLHALLIVLYPVHTPELIDVTHALKLIAVQDKYAIPGTTMFFITSIVVGRNWDPRDPPAAHPTEDVLDVYAVAWRMGFRKEALHFARYTHAIDFASSPETVDRLMRNSEGSSKSFIALAEMRRVREAALDGLIEALEPRKNFCAAHSASDGMFFAFVAMLKTAARNALLHPYPGTKLLGEDADAFEFLGLKGEDERRVVTWCSGCYARADRKRLTAQLSAAIEKYPQTISIMPDGDFWGEWS